MLQFNLDIIFVQNSFMGQGFSDSGEIKDVVTGYPDAANLVACIDEI